MNSVNWPQATTTFLPAWSALSIYVGVAFFPPLRRGKMTHIAQAHYAQALPVRKLNRPAGQKKKYFGPIKAGGPGRPGRQKKRGNISAWARQVIAGKRRHFSSYFFRSSTSGFEAFHKQYVKIVVLSSSLFRMEYVVVVTSKAYLGKAENIDVKVPG